MKIFWMCAILLGLLAQNAWAASVPLKDFARPEQYSSVKISPDGTYLAIKVPESDRTSLVFMRIHDQKIEKITGTLRPGVDEHINDFWWKGNNRVLATLARKDGYIAQPISTGELVAIGADGKGYHYLYGYNGSIQAGTHLSSGTKHYGYLQMIDPMIDDPSKALVSITSWRDRANGRAIAEYIDVHSGALDAIAPSPILGGWSSSFLSDDSGRVRYVSGLDPEFHVLAYRRDIDATEWVQLDTKAFG